ncbi:MAG TPA: hypothetical protein VNT75_19790 [Symbiobacteriaceae bacterium]|nr:hypothetical protein [Symbiobacteriaceae bacterium]
MTRFSDARRPAQDRSGHRVHAEPPARASQAGASGGPGLAWTWPPAVSLVPVIQRKLGPDRFEQERVTDGDNQFTIVQVIRNELGQVVNYKLSGVVGDLDQEFLVSPDDDKYQPVKRTHEEKEEEEDEEEEEAKEPSTKRHAPVDNELARRREMIETLGARSVTFTVKDLGRIVKPSRESDMKLPSREVRSVKQVTVSLADWLRAPAKYNNYRTHLQGAVEALLEQEKAGDPDLLAVLHYIYEELYIPPSSSSGGGGGNLRVTADQGRLTISGRPGFEQETIEGVPLQKGEHRRHVIAWHSLSAAVGNAVNRFLELSPSDGPKQLVEVFSKLAEAFKGPPKPQQEQPRRGRQKPPEAEPKTDLERAARLVREVLTKINSNVKNLWPGDGYENSLINTYQGLLRRWAAEASGYNWEELRKWRAERVADLYTRIEQKDGRFKKSLQELAFVLASWAPPEKSEDAEAGKAFTAFLHLCADNFEADFPIGEDRAYEKNKAGVARGLLQLAGTFMEWAENPGKALAKFDADAGGLLAAMDKLLRDFMNPPEPAKQTAKSQPNESKTPESSKQAVQDEAQAPLHETQPNGDCLYQAVNIQLGNPPDTIFLFRQMSAAWLMRHPDFAINVGATIQEALQTIMFAGNWEGAAGDLAPYLLATVTGHTLEIVTADRIYLVPPLEGAARGTLRIYYHANHYTVAPQEVHNSDKEKAKSELVPPKKSKH